MVPLPHATRTLSLSLSQRPGRLKDGSALAVEVNRDAVGRDDDGGAQLPDDPPPDLQWDKVVLATTCTTYDDAPRGTRQSHLA